MILDNLYTTLTDYSGMGGKLAQAFAWLKANDLKAMQHGDIVEIDGKRIIAKAIEFVTEPPENGDMEQHLCHVDIQMLVEGEETLHWTPRARTGAVKNQFDIEQDMVYFEPSETQAIKLQAGDFVVFFPSDAHKGQCLVDGKPGKGKKILVKIAVQ